MTISKIKNIVITHFYGENKTKELIKFRLIHTSKFKWLIDDYNATNEEINKNDELMLINIRPASIKENLSETTLKGPSEEAILQVTNGLCVHNAPQHIPFAHYPINEKLKQRCKPNINPNTIEALIEMGYSKKKVQIALHLRKSNMMEALEWLTEHQNDPEDEDDLDLTIFEKGNINV
ncbi:hypothetical protein ANTPLA_LOCUS8054 [Anthophora plagiata]